MVLLLVRMTYQDQWESHQWNEPDVIEALSAFEKVVKTKDKLIGTHVIEPDQTVLNKKIEEGYNFIAFSLDTLFLGSKVDEELNI